MFLPTRQRGFGLLEIVIFVAIASAVVALLHAAYRWVDNTWETSAGITQGKRLEHAAMQPKLDGCNADLADATVKLATQSASIAAAASAAKAQAASARKLADEARVATADTRTEIQRLADAIQKGSGATVCPAGAAVSKVREGLK